MYPSRTRRLQQVSEKEIIVTSRSVQLISSKSNWIRGKYAGQTIGNGIAKIKASVITSEMDITFVNNASLTQWVIRLKSVDHNAQYFVPHSKR